MRELLKKPIRYCEIDKIIYVFDQMSNREIAITKWEKAGKGNTCIASQDGTNLTLSYLYVYFQKSWLLITVDHKNGISISEIDKQDVEKIGPAIWFKNAKSNNW